MEEPQKEVIPENYSEKLETIKSGIQNAYQLQELEVLKLKLDTLFEEASFCIGYKSAFLADIEHQIGLAYYYLDDELTAIKHWEKAVEIWGESENTDLYHFEIGKECYNIGDSYNRLRKKKKAFEYLSKADTVLKSEEYLARNHGALGVYFKDFEFDFQKSLIHFQSAIGKFQNVLLHLDSADISKKEKVEHYIGKTYDDIAKLHYENLNIPETALDYNEKAEKVFRSLNSSDELPVLYNNRGLIYQKLWLEDTLQVELLDSAELYFRKALKIETQKNNKAGIKRNHNNIGLTQYFKEDYLYAEESFFTSKRINNEVKDRKSKIINFKYLGDLYLEWNKLEKALENYDSSIVANIGASLPKNCSELLQLDPNKVYDFNQLFTTLTSKTDALLKRKASGDLECAYQLLPQMEAVIREIRSNYLADASGEEFTKNIKAAFETGIEVSRELFADTGLEKYKKEAYEFAEKGKSIVLRENMTGLKLKKIAGIDPILLEEEEELRKDFAFFQKERQLAIQAGKLGKKSFLLDSITRISNQMEVIINKLESNENYRRLKKNDEIGTVENIQKELNDSTALIQYFIGEKKNYVFTITQNDFFIKELKIKLPDLKQAVDSLLYVTESLYPEDFFPIYYRNSKLIYNEIFPSEVLDSSVKNLLIIPDDIVGFVPFEALPTSVENPDEPAYLIHKYKISYNVSAAFLKNTGDSDSKKVSVLCVAPLYPEATKIDSLVIKNVEFPPLRYNDEEVASIAEVVGGTAFAENKSDFLKLAENHGILHLATHGLANDRNADLSLLGFRPSGNFLPESEILVTREIYGLPQMKNVKMLVLSACQTGAGEVRQGEGVISLARAFLYSGVESIVTTLWSVNSQSKSELMRHFYKNLKAGKPKDEALQNAKLELIKSGQYSNPAYWAGYLSYGNPESVDITGCRDWFWGKILATGLICVFVFWGWRRRSS